MSNSSLITYKKISPNKNSPRNHKIDTISIHCYVGQCTAKSGCDYFANSSVQCSPNYVVGYDGSIGLSVEEKDRSWCTSSPSNDNRAVTIEVACEPKHPYKVTDKAMKALIELVADICKRNGIKKLLWKGNPSLIGQVGVQNMTVHRWFANKACPGDYLYGKHSYIANEVNKILGNKVENKTTDKKPTVKKPDVIYRVRTDGRWLPEVKNLEDYAGIPGKAITDVAIKFTEGDYWYQVHVKGEGWLGKITKYDINDYHHGYAGNGKPIDKIRVYYNTPSRIVKGLGYLKATYRVAPIGTDYFGWQHDCETMHDQDGYAGMSGVLVDRFQILLE